MVADRPLHPAAGPCRAAALSRRALRGVPADRAFRRRASRLALVARARSSICPIVATLRRSTRRVRTREARAAAGPGTGWCGGSFALDAKDSPHRIARRQHPLAPGPVEPSSVKRLARAARAMPGDAPCGSGFAWRPRVRESPRALSRRRAPGHEQRPAARLRRRRARGGGDDDLSWRRPCARPSATIWWWSKASRTAVAATVALRGVPARGARVCAAATMAPASTRASTRPAAVSRRDGLR